MTTTIPDPTTERIAALEEEIANLRNQVAPPPHVETESERLARVTAAHAAIWGPVRRVDPMAGLRPTAAPNIIRERPKITREDRGWGIVYCGDAEAFYLHDRGLLDT